MMTREMVEVTYRFVDGLLATQRYDVALVDVQNGTLELYDRGLIAAFAPGQWLNVQRVDPETEDKLDETA